MEFVLLMGLQGSGKTTFFNERFASSFSHISKDHFPKAKNRDRRQSRLIREALAEGQSVVIDNTNPSAEIRSHLLALADEFGAKKIGYYFESIVADCKVRNAAREESRRVPNVAIHTTIKVLERPTMEEGFHALYHVRIGAEGFIVSDWREDDES